MKFNNQSLTLLCKSDEDQILKYYLIWYTEGSVPACKHWLQSPIDLQPIPGILKISATHLSSSVFIGNHPWSVQKLHALYSPLPGLILRKQLLQYSSGQCLVSRELLPITTFFISFHLSLFCPYSYWSLFQISLTLKLSPHPLQWIAAWVLAQEASFLSQSV